MNLAFSLFKNFGLYALLIALLGYYYYSAQSLKRDNKAINNNLQGALSINESLNDNIKQMRNDFNNQLQVVSETHNEEKILNKKVESVKYENEKNTDGDIVKRFNSMLDRLYQQ